MSFNRFANYFFRRKSSRRDFAFNDVIDYPDEASISSSTPSLRISSAPSVRASMRSRLDRSVTPPLPLLAGPPGPVHLEARSTSTNYSPSPINVEHSTSIRIEPKKSFPTDQVALSCPAVVAIETTTAHSSASSPSARQASGFASVKPIPGSVLGSTLGSIPSPTLGSVPGPTLGSVHGPTLGSVPGPTRGSAPGPTLGFVPGHTRGSASGSTLGFVSGPTRGSAPGPTLGSVPSPTRGSVHAPILGSVSGPILGSDPSPTLGPVPGPIPGPARPHSRGPTSEPSNNHVPAPLPQCPASLPQGPAPLPQGPAPLPQGPAPLPPGVLPTRDWTPVNEGPCAAGPPCSSSTPPIQSPSTPPPPAPPPLEEHPSCSCGREVELLRNETRLLRAELTKSRQVVTQMKEREKLLRQRLSEQARRQLERGGSTKFEDLSLGENRPSQLIRRYGNLYSDGRLDALDALDELREVAEFNDLKQKLLLSVIVLAFRNARRNIDEMKSQVRHLLRISDQPPPPPPPHPHPQHPGPSSSGRDLAVTLRGARPLTPSHPAVIELEEIISAYLRKTLEHQNLTKNYQEVRERVWATLFDFPKLRFCRGLQLYIEECVRLAWALALQNPPYVVDYKAKTFSPDTHTRFHTSNPDSIRIRMVLWPALREGGDTGPCVYKGVVVT